MHISPPYVTGMLIMCRSGGLCGGTVTLLFVAETSAQTAASRSQLLVSRTVFPGWNIDTGGERRLLNPRAKQGGFCTSGWVLFTLQHRFQQLFTVLSIT